MPEPWPPDHEARTILSWPVILAMGVMAIGVWEALRAILLSATGHTQKKLKTKLEADIAKLAARVAKVEAVVTKLAENPNLVFLDKADDEIQR